MNYKKGIVIALIVCIIAFALLSVQKIAKESFENPTSTSDIPKLIWSYWDNPDTVPVGVKLCIQSWEKHNPNYTIRFLNKSNYSEYVQIPNEIAQHPRFNDIPQRFADLLRLYLIVEHGGVWCDSSILMNESLDNWLKPIPGKDFYGFTIEYGNHPGRKPILENWFFAAPKQSAFVKAWLQEFTRLKNFASAKDYTDDLVSRGLDNKDWCCPDYLAQHHSNQKLIQLDNYPLDSLQLWPSEKGPFAYLIQHNWNASSAIRAACKDKSLRKPFLKLRGGERSTLEAGLTGEFSNETCHWV